MSTIQPNETLEEPFLLLDVNKDGNVDLRDLSAFRNLVLDQIGPAENPFNNFNIFDVIDFQGTRTEIKGIEEETKKIYNEIMGLPPVDEIMGSDGPHGELTHTMKRILNKSIVITMQAMSPKYEGIDGDSGLDLFSVQKYRRSIGISGGGSADAGVESLFPTGIPGLKMKGDPFKFAVQVENSFNESWSNDFGESSFESLANVGSTLGSEVKFITGQDSLSRAFGDILGNTAGTIGGGIDTLVDGLGGDMGGAIKRLLTAGNDNATRVASNVEDKLSQSNLGRGILKIASGSKVDFPMIWRGSSFQPNYSFTVKLWNPFPSSEEHYIKYILNPIYHLLLFMCPVSDSNFTYNFPVLCRLKCPGLGGIDAGFISNMDIIKGGDNNDISFKQRPGLVEIRFSVQSLYNTMIIRGEMDVTEDRPSLDKYMRDLLGQTIPPEYYYNNNTTNNTIYSPPNLSTSNIVSSPQNTTTTKEILEDTAISISELEYLDAISDPILNNVFEDETVLHDSNISSVAKYKAELETVKEQRQIDNNIEIFQLPLEDRIAIKIKHGVPISNKLVNWFWNNKDNFDLTTTNIVRNITEPNIRAFSIDEKINSSQFKNLFNLNNNKSATKTGTF